MRALAFVLNAILALGLLVWLGLHFAWIRIPPNILPWAALDLDAPPGWSPRLRINSLSMDGPQCLMTLARSQLLYTPVDERPVKDGCGLELGVKIERSQIPYNQVFEARCAVVAGLYWYERDLEALARAHLGAGIARIDHWGTYACRNINARKEGRRSHMRPPTPSISPDLFSRTERQFRCCATGVPIPPKAVSWPRRIAEPAVTSTPYSDRTTTPSTGITSTSTWAVLGSAGSTWRGAPAPK